MKTLFGAVLSMVGMIALAGCQGEDLKVDAAPQFEMVASHEAVLEGETVTFTTRTANTLGRSAEIQWQTSAGHEIQTSADNRVAQITFDEPGMYTVSADLVVNGNRVQTQTQTVDVRPLARGLERGHGATTGMQQDGEMQREQNQEPQFEQAE